MTKSICDHGILKMNLIVPDYLFKIKNFFKDFELSLNEKTLHFAMILALITMTMSTSTYGNLSEIFSKIDNVKPQERKLLNNIYKHSKLWKKIAKILFVWISYTLSYKTLIVLVQKIFEFVKAEILLIKPISRIIPSNCESTTHMLVMYNILNYYNEPKYIEGCLTKIKLGQPLFPLDKQIESFTFKYNKCKNKKLDLNTNFCNISDLYDYIICNIFFQSKFDFTFETLFLFISEHLKSTESICVIPFQFGDMMNSVCTLKNNLYFDEFTKIDFEQVLLESEPKNQLILYAVIMKKYNANTEIRKQQQQKHIKIIKQITNINNNEFTKLSYQ